MEALEIGGAIAIALALVEVIKLLINKFTDIQSSSLPSANGYVKEAVWRNRIGTIIEEQHEIIKGLQELLTNQNEFLHKLLELMITLEDRSQTTIEKIESLERLTDHLEAIEVEREKLEE